MAYQTTNPVDGVVTRSFDTWREPELETSLQTVAGITPIWAQISVEERCNLVRKIAAELRDNNNHYAGLISLEMGKLIKEARAEIEKCALACDYYAENGPAFMADVPIETDASRSYIAYHPLGTILAVMPWNFPFWQVFRFAAPALIGGNTAVLKHASNVPQCALAIEEVIKKAGIPDGVFKTLMISAKQVAGVIADSRVHAATLTGSEAAGRQVAKQAGDYLKKVVLELGGSDAFVVLEDADLEWTVSQAVASRFLNCGQSCIAAKRFIVVESIADDFVSLFKAQAESLQLGNPMDETTGLAPMARLDLRDDLHKQVTASVKLGAEIITGGEPGPGPGAFYQATILDQVEPGMPAYEEELFGPVASVIRVSDADEALRVANSSRFGLGGSIWTKNTKRGEALARAMQSGACFINGMVKSDPRLPFGGIKSSGFGRELSYLGLREFLNAQTVWVK